MSRAIPTIWAKGAVKRGEITKDEFTTVHTAWKRTVAVLEVEEKFNLLVENYADYERELLNIALTNMVFRDMEWSRSMDEIYSVNRRLLNLLMSFQLYLDQVRRDVKALFDRKALQTLDDAVTGQEQSSFAWRFILVLRNYSQHAGMPIYSVRLATETAPNGLEYRAAAHIQASDLQKDQQVVKSGVLNSLPARQDTFDVTPYVRDAMVCFSSIHTTTRSLIHVDHDARFQLLEEWLDTYDGSKRETVVLNCEEERFTVFCDLMKRLRYLLKRNRLLEFSAERYVSGKCDA